MIVIKYQKEVGREKRKEQQMRSKRKIGKRRTGMNEVPNYMDACVKSVGEREKGDRATQLYISSLCVGF